MDKREFLNILEYELGNMNAASKADVLNDFQEHFDIAQKSGKSEEEICRALGDPKEIARDFYTERGENIRHFDDSRSEPQCQHSLGQSSYVNTSDAFIKSVEASHIKTIRLELYNSDLTIEGECTDRINIEVEDGCEIRYITTVSANGVFSIKERSNYKRHGAEISLALPKDFSGILDIETKKGDLSVSCLTNLQKISAKIASGDIDVSEITCAEDFAMTSASGDVSVSEIHSGRFSVKTGSGDVRADTAEARASFSMATGSGDIGIGSCSCPEGLHISTGSGDITSDTSNGKLRASTGSGDVIISEHAGTVWASTGSGDIAVHTDEITSDVTYSSGSGDITVACESLNANIRMSSGSGEIDFKAKNVHGDILAKTGSDDISVSLGRCSDVRFVYKINRNYTIRNEFYEIHGEECYNNQQAQYKVQLEANSGDIDIRAI